MRRAGGRVEDARPPPRPTRAGAPARRRRPSRRSGRARRRTGGRSGAARGPRRPEPPRARAPRRASRRASGAGVTCGASAGASRRGRRRVGRPWFRGCPARGVHRWPASSPSGQYWMTLVTRRPSSRSRPLRKSSSTRNASPTTSPRSRSTSSIVPLTVPPVASRSSTIRTCWPGLDRVAMDLEGVRAVLERVLDRDRLGRQLAQLADRHEAGAQLVGHRGAEDEAARLHPDDDVDLLAQVGLAASGRWPPCRRPDPSAAS